MSLSESRMCQEPPVSIGYYDGRGSFHYAIKGNDDGLILSFENKFRKDQFRVISLQTIELWEKGDKAHELILVRKK